MKTVSSRVQVLPGFLPYQPSDWKLVGAFEKNRRLPGSQEVTSFSPDGETWVCGTDKGKIGIFSYQEGSFSTVISAHKKSIRDIIFVSDSYFASCSDDGHIKLWSLSNPSSSSENIEISRKVALTSLAINPFSKILAVGGTDSNIYLVDIPCWKVISTLSGHKASIKTVVFSDDGKFLASGDSGGRVKIWDLESRKQTLSILAHEGGVKSLSLSSQARQIFSAGADGTVKQFDLVNRHKFTIQNHVKSINSIALSPDSQFILSGSEDGNINIWDSDTRNLIASLDNKNSASVTSIAVHPNSQFLLISRADGTFSAWWIKRKIQVRKNRRFSPSQISSLATIRDIIVSLIVPALFSLIFQSLVLGLLMSGVMVGLCHLVVIPIFNNHRKANPEFHLFPDSAAIHRDGKKIYQLYELPAKIDAPNWILSSLKFSPKAIRFSDPRMKPGSRNSTIDQSSDKNLYASSQERPNILTGLVMDAGKEIAQDAAKEFFVNKIMGFLGFQHIDSYSRSSGTQVNSHYRRRPRG
jgi:WD40 repeat protein